MTPKIRNVQNSVQEKGKRAVRAKDEFFEESKPCTYGQYNRGLREQLLPQAGGRHVSWCLDKHKRRRNGISPKEAPISPILALLCAPSPLISTKYRVNDCLSSCEHPGILLLDTFETHVAGPRADFLCYNCLVVTCHRHHAYVSPHVLGWHQELIHDPHKSASNSLLLTPIVDVDNVYLASESSLLLGFVCWCT
jgi:hypothetical protein